MGNSINLDSRVLMHFRISLENGFVVEDTFDNEPFSFMMGDGSLISGMENVLHGLQQFDEKLFRLTSSNAFGPKSEENIHSVALEEFPEDVDVKEGYIIGFSTPSGEEVPGTVLSINEENALIDFNHPLAGQTILFEVKILEIS